LLDYRTPVPLETTRDRSVVGIARCRTSVDDEIDGGQLMLVQAEGFANETLDVITTDRVADDAGGNRQSKAGRCCAGVAREDREVGVGAAARITIDAIEFGFMPEALRRFERTQQVRSEGRVRAWLRRRVQTVRRLRPFARRRART
jgi:hypothetical protein